MVIDRDMDVIKAHPALTTHTPMIDLIGAVDTPPAAIGDTTELLHIDMDQVSRLVPLIPMVGAA